MGIGKRLRLLTSTTPLSGNMANASPPTEPPPPPPSGGRVRRRVSDYSLRAHAVSSRIHDQMDHRRGSQHKFAKSGVSLLMKKAHSCLHRDGEGHELLQQSLNTLNVENMPNPIRMDDPFVVRVLQIFFSEADVNKDGDISPTEFANAVSMIGDKLGDKFRYLKPMSLFASLDVDGDGKIALSELLKGVEATNDTDFLLACSAVDAVRKFFGADGSDEDGEGKEDGDDGDDGDDVTSPGSSPSSSPSTSALSVSLGDLSVEIPAHIIAAAAPAASPAASPVALPVASPVAQKVAQKRSKWSMLKRSSAGNGAIVFDRGDGNEALVSTRERPSTTKTNHWGSLAQTLKDAEPATKSVPEGGTSRLRRRFSSGVFGGGPYL